MQRQLVVDRSRPISVQSYEILRTKILRLELKPGEALSEKQLAESMNVSRTPIREAFIKLSEEGLVEIYPQYGTFVSLINLRAVAEAHFVREALECAIVREAAKQEDKTLVLNLKQSISDQRKAGEAQDYQAFFELDEAFHKNLSRAAGRAGVWRFIQNAKLHMDRVRQLTLPISRALDILVTQHEAILDALLAGDPDSAADSMKLHLSFLFGQLDNLKLHYPVYFSSNSDEVNV